MLTPTVHYPSTALLVADVAERFLTFLASVQDAGRDPQVVLTGGTLADALYGQIARHAASASVDWSRVDFWWGDERFVAPDSPDRNARQARARLLDAVGATRIHEMPSSNAACSAEEGARAYEAQVRQSGAGQFDLVLLSLGPDGHIASLFPGSPQVNAAGRIAVGVTGSPKPPPERITLTLEALNRSDRVWLFAAESGPGAAKEAAYERVKANDPAIPATQVHGAVETIWFVS